jgi:N-methylhydantoinase B
VPATPDPITTEIIRNMFLSAAHDMNATLFRSAFTPVIYEGLDCAVALLDENADVLGQAAGVPLFVGNLEVCVKITTDLLGVDAYEPGDVFLMNDPYLQGTHLNDATVFAPIFHEDALAGFAATRAHWLDVGGKDPGVTMDSTEVYQEGVRFGPTKIVSRYQPREELLDHLRRNSRFGTALIGDLNAQIAACRTGEARLKAIIGRFGREAVSAAKLEIARQSAQLDREAIASIPDGVYAAEGSLDNDGIGDAPVPVKVRVEIAGDRMTVDLAGSAPATRGPVNCGIAQTISAVRMAYKLLIHPDRPVDGGTFPTLTIHAPEGTIFHAQEPSACQWYFTPLGLMTDLIVRALAPAIPERVAAAHYGDSMVVATAGRDPRRNDAPFLTIEPTPGGWGGYAGGDGQDGLINNVNGAFRDFPVEVWETKYPVQIVSYGIRPDSGGAGEWRGGCGLERVYRFETDATVYLWFERSRTPAWGLFGGADAAGPHNEVRGSFTATPLKVNALPVKRGDELVLRTGGGGGFGDPLTRDPARVLADVRAGYLTREAAERDYAVVLTDELFVDEVATGRLRAARRKPSPQPLSLCAGRGASIGSAVPESNVLVSGTKRETPACADASRAPLPAHGERGWGEGRGGDVAAFPCEEPSP